MNSKIAAVILMGGQNTRMKGKHKAFLTLGGKTFLEIITDQLKIIPDIYLSVNDINKFKHLQLPLIEDCYCQIGPLGGIYSAFKALPDYDYLFFIGCDTPFITREYIHFLLTQLSYSVDCLALSNQEGFIYPLGAIYSRKILPYAEQMINDGNYRLQTLVRSCAHQLIPISQTPFDENLFRNINTPEEYRQCLMDFSN